ncbi:MAG: NAD-dependent epimerase/dehydratase family protein [Lachnospiraceae bacterium]|nr:NAD-dependent epimerase/dehydratase family protein [Lachnospiraceae bacterium]
MIIINVLICGSYTAFQRSLIAKLRKEDHEIYVLTGDESGIQKSAKGVFQQYDFAFTSDRVVNVIQNVNPEIVIFADSLADKEELALQNKSVEYISGLVNVVTAAKLGNVKKFIYLSSLYVHDGNTENKITELIRPMAATKTMETIAQGERLCVFYREPDEFEVKIVRLPEVYGVQDSHCMQNNVLVDMLTQANAEGKVKCRPNSEHIMIGLKDAVEACYALSFHDPEEPHVHYNVPGTVVTEQEIVDLLKKTLFKDLEVEESRQVKDRIAKEFSTKRMDDIGFKLRNHIEDSIKEINNIVKKNKKKNTGKEGKRRTFDIVVRQLIENALMFALAYALTLLFKGTWFGEIVDFYLIYVVIIAAVLGTTQSLIAVVLSAIGHFSAAFAVDGMFAVLIDFERYVWVLQLLLIGVVVSYVRDKLKTEIADLKEENRYDKRELKEIKEINESNVYIKNVFEKRLVNYKNSMSKIYEITSELDYLESQKVVFQAAKVISQTMECKNVAVYVGNGASDYYRLAASTSDESRQLGNSFKLDKESRFFEQLSENGIYRNVKLDQKLPILAGVTHYNGAISAIIMVWPEELETTTLYQANLLALLCKLVEKSIGRAFEFMDALFRDSYYEDTNIMKEQAFLQCEETLREGMENGLSEYCKLELVVEQNTEKEMAMAEGLIRDTDYIGIVKDKVQILLANTSRTEVSAVVTRFANNHLKVVVVD